MSKGKDPSSGTRQLMSNHTYFIVSIDYCFEKSKKRKSSLGFAEILLYDKTNQIPKRGSTSYMGNCLCLRCFFVL